MWYNDLAKTHEHRAIMLTAPSARPTCVLADFHGVAASGAYCIGEKSAMNVCRVCLKHRFEINAEGVCPKCQKALKRFNKTVRVDYVNATKAIPRLSNGCIFSKTEWVKVKTAVDAYYNSVSIDDIDAYNLKLRQAQKAKEGSHAAKGHIYLLSSSVGFYKIGRAFNVETRITQHLRQYPIEINLIHKIRSSDVIAAEQFVLNKFTDKRMQGEWFSLSEEDVNWFALLDEFSLANLVAEWKSEKSD